MVSIQGYTKVTYFINVIKNSCSIITYKFLTWFHMNNKPPKDECRQIRKCSDCANIGDNGKKVLVNIGDINICFPSVGNSSSFADV